jgi:pimeloyl-ACP methyl ester carboxylesterase
VQVPPVRYVDVDGLQVAYQVVGAGPVDRLYVPGMLNHMEATWDDADGTAFAERLGSFARLILLDKRGTGLSDRLPPGHHATVEQRTRDVLAVLDAVGSEAAFLFATADGTPIGMAAAAHPDRVRGLVLYAPSARILADEGYPGLPHDKMLAALARTSRRWGDDQEPAHVQLLAPSRADDRRWRATMARMQRRSCTPRAAAEYWELNCRIDVRAVLPVIDVPTLVLHCSGDRVYRIEQGRYVARHLANVRWIELEGSDHLFFSEHGERVADEIEEFVTGRRSGPTAHRRLATVL